MLKFLQASWMKQLVVQQGLEPATMLLLWCCFRAIEEEQKNVLLFRPPQTLERNKRCPQASHDGRLAFN